MLERTAASLEPCNIHRVLPSTSTANPFISRRRISSTFWQHGAAEIDLPNACQVMSREMPEPPEPSTPAHSQADTVIASTFLLDFLYPHGAATLLRKLSPTVLERYERPKSRLHTHGPRLYATAATSWQSSRETSQINYQSQSASVVQSEATTPKESERGKLPVAYDQDETLSDQSTFPLTKDVGSDEKRERHVIKNLRQLLLVQEPKEEHLSHIWDAYHELKDDLRPSIRPEVIASLAQSRSPIWASRIIQLFAELNPLQWNARVVSIAISASLRLGKEMEAVDIFQQALRRQTSRGSVSADSSTSIDDLVPTDGLNYLVLHAFRTSAWEMLFDIWRHVFDLSPTYKFKTTSLEEFTAVPDIYRKMFDLYRLTSGADEHDESNDLHTALRTNLLKPLLRILLPKSRPRQTFSLVQNTGEPSIMRDFILLCISCKNSRLAAKAYEIYRTLPGVRIKESIFSAMVRDVYYPKNNAAGMEAILEDWYKRYGKLSVFGYQKFLAFYASRGDIQSVNRMWKEYVEHYPWVLKRYSDTFTFLLQVHAVRGDIQQVRKTFDEIKGLHDIQPPTECWNILLNTYAKTQDYDQALQLFDDLCSSTEPDHYSFGIIMGMSGSRGDLDTTLYLYRMSRDKGVKPSMTMLDCIIEAYCQNNAFTLAENIAVTTTRKRRIGGNYTLLWNTLLHHHALRLDLTTVNRLLASMSQMGVPYDHKTFDSLLKALVFCRQSHHALHLLRVAAKDHAFKPTQSHYILLMSAFIRTNEPERALYTHRLMYRWGFPETSERILKVIEALGQYRHRPSVDTDGKEVEGLSLALREFRRSLNMEGQDTNLNGDTGTSKSRQAAYSPSKRTEQASLLIFLFSEMRDFATVQQIIDLYNSSAPESEGRTEMPLELLNSILYAYFREEKFNKVHETWTTIFNKACKIAAPPGGRSGILPRYHYLLVDPLKTMLPLYEAQNDSDGLIQVISQVTSAGFKLDNKNWNYYVQALARLKRWQDAFNACEEVLVARWTGWGVPRRRQRVKNQLPLDLRRIGSSREYLRPISYTLFVLAKEYMVIEQLAPWTPENSRIFAEINRRCPRTVGAVKALKLTGSEAEEAVFSQLVRDLDNQTEATDEEAGSSPLISDEPSGENEHSPSEEAQRSSPVHNPDQLPADKQATSSTGKRKKRSRSNDPLSAEDEDFLSKGLQASGSSSIRGPLPQFDEDDEAWLSDGSDTASGR